MTAAMTINSGTTIAMIINSETTAAMMMESEILSTGVLAAIITIPSLFGLVLMVALTIIIVVLVVQGTQSKVYHYRNINTATVTAPEIQTEENVYMVYSHLMHNLKPKSTVYRVQY